MGKHSQFEQYRGEVVACFNAGEQPGKVCKKYPEISRGTVYDWHRQWRNKARKNSGNSLITLVSIPPPPSTAEVIPIEDSDLELVRKTLRSIVRNKQEFSAAVIIQACNCLLRANEVARNMPPEPASLDIDISLLTDEALKLAIAQRRSK